MRPERPQRKPLPAPPDPARVAAFVTAFRRRAAPRCCCLPKGFGFRRGASGRRSARSISWRGGEKPWPSSRSKRGRETTMRPRPSRRASSGGLSPPRAIGSPPIRATTPATSASTSFSLYPGAFHAISRRRSTRVFEPAKTRRSRVSGVLPCPCNVAVQMDPIERINIRGDSTFALLLEAQTRGHAIVLLHAGPHRAA